MTIEETGREYLRQSRELFNQAEKVREGMCFAKSGGDLCRMREQHEKLLEIARDMRSTGEYLVHYYEE